MRADYLVEWKSCEGTIHTSALIIYFKKTGARAISYIKWTRRRRFNVPKRLPILDLTILLFRGDLHMREFDATVVSVEGNFVVLDARAGSEVSEG